MPRISCRRCGEAIEGAVGAGVECPGCGAAGVVPAAKPRPAPTPVTPARPAAPRPAPRPEAEMVADAEYVLDIDEAAPATALPPARVPAKPASNRRPPLLVAAPAFGSVPEPPPRRKKSGGGGGAAIVALAVSAVVGVALLAVLVVGQKRGKGEADPAKGDRADAVRGDDAPEPKAEPESAPAPSQTKPSRRRSRVRPTLAEIQEGLRSPDATTRLDSVLDMRDFNPAAEVGLRALLPLTQDPDSAIAAAACDALPRYGMGAGGFLTEIAAGLKSGTPGRRAACGHLLDALTPVPAASVPVLRDLLDRAGPEGQAAALRALARMSKADLPADLLGWVVARGIDGRLPVGGVADVLKTLAPLRPEHSKVLLDHSKAAAGSSLGRPIGDLLAKAEMLPSDSAKFWAERLGDADPARVVEALGKLDELPGDAAGLNNRVPGLCEHRDGGVRAAAVRIFFARLPALAVARLGTFLADPDPKVREAVQDVVGRIPLDGPGAHPVAERLANSGDPVQTRRAAKFVRDVPLPPVSSMPLLGLLIGSKDPETVALAIEAVDKLPLRSAPLRDRVTMLVGKRAALEAQFGQKSPPEAVLRAAIALFQNAGPDGVTPLVATLEVLSDDKERVRVVQALGAIGVPAEGTVRQLLELCGTPKDVRPTELRDAVTDAIGKMGPGACKGILATLSEQRDEVLWFYALKAAGKLGKNGASLRDKLKPFTTYRKSKIVANEAADALRRVGG